MRKCEGFASSSAPADQQPSGLGKMLLDGFCFPWEQADPVVAIGAVFVARVDRGVSNARDLLQSSFAEDAQP
jgi:hypothetical protein